MTAIPEIRTERLRLVPFDPTHLDRLLELHRSEAVARFWGPPEDDWPGLDEQISGLTIILDPGETPDGVIGEIVGFIQAAEERDPKFRSASIDLFIAGPHQRRGLGREAITALAAHLIDERGHHHLTIDPEAANAAAVGCYRKVGFEPVGILRRNSRVDGGEWADTLLMDLLAEELVRDPAA